MPANDKKMIRLLVVDDEDMIREILVTSLTGKGYAVSAASGGDEAFQYLLANPVDIVISDIRMPKGDGISLLDNIQRKIPSKPALIFITGFADLGEAECLERGAKAVLAKPFEGKKLLETIQQVLAGAVPNS